MLETIITSSVLIAVLTLLRYIFKGRIILRLQYAVWLLVALRLLLPFSLFESSFSVLNVAGLSQQANIGVPAAISAAPDLSNTAAVNTAGAAVNNPVSSGAPVQAGGSAADTVGAVPASQFDDILRIVWLSGTAAVGLWFIIQNLRLYGRLRKSRKPLLMPDVRLSVYQTGCLPFPCLFGLFRPAIYLTPDSGADAQTVKYILAHEETHYRHGDHLWSYLRCICLAVHWFNPLVWWAAALSRRDCELACDESTLNRIGNLHRKDYGNTLITMIVKSTKPSDLLLGATTMTSGKRGIRERITMIARKPKMLFPTLLAVILLVAAVAGCTFTGAGNTDKKDEIVPLTAEELDFFNGDKFFNGEAVNIRNQFLSSLYDAPEKIDLFELFYSGSTQLEIASEAERAAVVEVNKWDMEPDCACEKVSRANMDAVLTEYMALTLDDTGKTGLDKFTYLVQFDAYYNYHGDTNYRGHIEFSGGEREGDVLRLYYTDTFYVDGDKVLTLREKDGGYLFVSNQKTGEDAEAAPMETFQPPNLGALSDTIIDAANVYMQNQFDYWSRYSGAWSTVDGKKQPVGEPASYDSWRLEDLSVVNTYEELSGVPVDEFRQSEGAEWTSLVLYKLVYRLHTTTPDKVMLAGGMNLDGDNWLQTDSPYLVFAMYDGHPNFLFAMIDDASPDAPMFAEDLSSRLNASKEAYTEACEHLRAVFDDGETSIWYVGAGEGFSETIPAARSYSLEKSKQSEERYMILFRGFWEIQDYISEPESAYVSLGDSPGACFRFYPGSDLVFWHDGDSDKSWFVGDSNGAALSDTVMREFSGYEVDITNVTLPPKNNEVTWDTVHRYLDAYGDYLINMTPENAYRVTDFRLLDVTDLQITEGPCLVRFNMAVKPPEELLGSTLWWMGNTGSGEGDLEGWLVMYREMILELKDGVWRCIGFGTGGASLD